MENVDRSWKHGEWMHRTKMATETDQNLATKPLSLEHPSAWIRNSQVDDLIDLGEDVIDLTMPVEEVRRDERRKNLGVLLDEVCYNPQLDCQHTWKNAFDRRNVPPPPKFSLVTQICVTCHTTNVWLKGDVLRSRDTVSRCQHHWKSLFGVTMCKRCHVTLPQLRQIRQRQIIEQFWKVLDS